MAETTNSASPVRTDELLIQELLTRGVATNEDGSSQIIPSAEALADRLRSGDRLSAYLGIDPTAPDLHIGHVSQLHRLRRLQDLGHEVILLIGDFTGRIGDPTDKSATRVRLTEEQVLANAAGYRKQAGKILDLDRPANPVRLAFNSEWLGKLTFADVLELASEVTVAQLEERDMFQRRKAEGKPISLTEFLYPIMQGYDSVRIAPGGVDIELGGSDQIFNMNMGRGFVKRHHGKEKFVLPGQLLVDPGGRKIGKTEGNMVTINDTPLAKYHKIMLWGDRITPHALELCTTMPISEIAEVKAALEAGELSGIDGKKLLASRLISELDGAEHAELAAKQYRQLIERSESLDPSIFDFESHTAKPGQDIVEVLVASGLVGSRNEARRLVAQNGVYVNEQPVDLSWTVPQGNTPLLLRRGKVRLDNYRMLVPPAPRRAVRRTAKKA